MRSTLILCASLCALAACDSAGDQQAAIRQRGLERAGDDPVALCRIAREHPGTPEAEAAEGRVAEQLSNGQARLTEARATRRLNAAFAAWLDGMLAAQRSAACRPLTVLARIHFERTAQNAESSVQQSVERTVEAALDTSDRQVLAEAVAQALAPLTGALVPRGSAVRVDEDQDEPEGTVIDIDCRLEGRDFLALEASTTLTLRQQGGTTTTLTVPVVVLPQESVDPHRSQRTSDASSLAMIEILRRLRARIIDGLGLRPIDTALRPYEGTWAARLGAVDGACPAPGVDLDGDTVVVDPGGRTLTIGERSFDAWVDGEELIAESHRIGGPCRSRLSEIIRFPATPEGELDGRWAATFEGHDDCERRCTRSATLSATRRPD